MKLFHGVASLGISFMALVLTGLDVSPGFCADDAAKPLVRKFDPRSSSFVPISPDEVIAGKIYSRYDKRVDGYVWAFALEGGDFSYSLGLGTTELPSNFDLATTASQTEDLIKSRAGDWAKLSESQGRQLLVRLQANGEWAILRTRSVRSHFDADSGRRWQWSGPRKVTVGHAGGYTWRYEGDWYVPANPMLLSAYLHLFPCGCADCR